MSEELKQLISNISKQYFFLLEIASKFHNYKELASNTLNWMWSRKTEIIFFVKHTPVFFRLMWMIVLKAYLSPIWTFHSKLTTINNPYSIWVDVSH